jgi:hypothetical protein
MVLLLILLAAATLPFMLVTIYLVTQGNRGATAAAPAGTGVKGASLQVQGWSEDELGRILQAFATLYALPEGLFRARERSAGLCVIDLTGEIQSEQLFYLVNYLHYPPGFDLNGRALAVLCTVTLSQSFALPDPALLGRRASLYVPAGDTDFDEVYVQLDTGAAYRVPFTDMFWEPVDDPRMPAAVRALRDAGG